MVIEIVLSTIVTAPLLFVLWENNIKRKVNV